MNIQWLESLLSVWETPRPRRHTQQNCWTYKDCEHRSLIRRTWSSWNSPAADEEWKVIQRQWEKVWQLLIKLNTHSLSDREIPLLCIYPRKMKTHVHKKTCTKIFISASVKNLKTWGVGRQTLINRRMTKWATVYSRAMDLTRKRNELLINVTHEWISKTFCICYAKKAHIVHFYLYEVLHKQIKYMQKNSEWRLSLKVRGWGPEEYMREFSGVMVMYLNEGLGLKDEFVKT